MSLKYHSIHAYAAFDTHITRVEQWLRPRLHAVLGCDVSTVQHRLVQRLVELTLGPFVTQLSLRVRAHQPFLHPEGVRLELNGISIDTDSGAVRLSWSFLMRACRDFAAHWLHALYSIARIGRGKVQGKATLVFGVGAESLFYGADDQRFVDYCAQSPIAPLAEATRLIVQHVARAGNCSSPRVVYARYPIDQLAYETRMSLLDWSILLLRHVLIPARYVWGILRCRPLALLSRDFALGPLLAALNRVGAIEAVIFTNSNYSIQPLWARAARAYESHMVWYSQNTIPFVMKADTFAADLPNYRYMQVDTHWVWTAGFAQYLSERGGRMKRVEVVGPVTWYAPEAPVRNSNAFTIGVFDITPVSSAYTESIGLLASYYNPENAIAFLEEIVDATAEVARQQEQSCRLRLKHKRQHLAIHDRGYINRVTQMLDQGKIENIPFDTNIYRFIAETDVVIVMPNSSPTYIASMLGVPSIYFDPTADMKPTFDPAEGISFASGKAELLEQLNTLCAARNKSRQVGKKTDEYIKRI